MHTPKRISLDEQCLGPVLLDQFDVFKKTLKHSPRHEKHDHTNQHHKRPLIDQSEIARERIVRFLALKIEDVLIRGSLFPSERDLVLSIHEEEVHHSLQSVPRKQ